VATIHSGSESDLSFLASVLRAGGLVAVPTETVYGLAANAFNVDACRQIFAVKGRPAYDPLIVHAASRTAADSVAFFNVLADELAPRFWPGPLTLVLRKRPLVPGIVTSGRSTVAVRVPAHPLFRALLERSGLALAAPSANPFGYISPTTAAHVEESLGHAIDHILDGGPCAVGVESTILDASNPHDPVILRLGGIPRDVLERALGRPVRIHQREAAAEAARTPVANGEPSNPVGELAPGMLDRHYSPRTPLEVRDRAFTTDELRQDDSAVARVCFRRPPVETGARDIFWLSETGDVVEAARGLFALLRQLDGESYQRLVFEPAPSAGLGAAINDRLRRAAAK
jgi:L-threonylcarbamoyladenylate synthase